MRRRSIMVAVALTVALVSSSSVIASLPYAYVHVMPAHGGFDTTFVLSFVAPTTTGTTGSTRVRDVLSTSNHPGSASCLGSVEIPISDHLRGLRMRVHLNPRKLGGRWCPGVYHGEVEELAQPVCPRGEVCPAYVILRGRIARFELHVRGVASGRSRDVAVPRFAGLERAFACTPGPQRPGQRTPYTLTWLPASDDITSQSQILYDAPRPAARPSRGRIGPPPRA